MISILRLLILTVGMLSLSTGCSLQRSSELSAQDLIRKGNRYYSGIWVPKDVEKAAEFYMRAAESGNADALCLVGRCYESGIGLPKNDVEATAYYGRAARGGSAEAQYRLGLAYTRGIGITKNQLLAYLWLNKAAASGMEKAASNRDALGCRLSPSEVAKAQKLSLD